MLQHVTGLVRGISQGFGMMEVKRGKKISPSQLGEVAEGEMTWL